MTKSQIDIDELVEDMVNDLHEVGIIFHKIAKYINDPAASPTMVILIKSLIRETRTNIPEADYQISVAIQNTRKENDK